jgi:hypothetical protein
VSIFVNHNATIQATRHHFAVSTNLAITKQYRLNDGRLLDASQLSHDALLVQHRVGVSYAAAEIRFELPDGQRRWYEVKCRGSG